MFISINSWPLAIVSLHLPFLCIICVVFFVGNVKCVVRRSTSVIQTVTLGCFKWIRGEMTGFAHIRKKLFNTIVKLRVSSHVKRHDQATIKDRYKGGQVNVG